MVTVCPKCGEKFTYARDRDSHLLTCNAKPKTPLYKCPYCDYVALTFEILSKHVIDVHSDYCPVCGRKLKKRNNELRTHAVYYALRGDVQHLVLAVLLMSRHKEIRKRIDEVKEMLINGIKVEKVYASPQAMITAKIDVELIQKLDEYAKQHHMSRSQAIKEAVKMLVDEQYAKARLDCSSGS